MGFGQMRGELSLKELVWQGTLANNKEGLAIFRSAAEGGTVTVHRNSPVGTTQQSETQALVSG